MQLETCKFCYQVFGSDKKLEHKKCRDKQKKLMNDRKMNLFGLNASSDRRNNGKFFYNPHLSNEKNQMIKDAYKEWGERL